MKGLALAAAGLVVFCAVIPPVLLSAVSTGAGAVQAAGPGGPLGGGGLDAARVPPQFLVLVQEAGSVCAGVPAAAIAAQLQQESGWDPNAVSPAGAQGIAQFMPGTWATWGTDANSDGITSPLEPGDAVPAQARYMCSLYGDVAAAARAGLVTGDVLQLAWAGYNAGLGSVLAAGGIPPFVETQRYVQTLARLMASFTAAAVSPPAGSSPVVAYGMTQVGLPYVWGGGTWDGPTGGGFDCSGLVLYAVAQATGMRVKLPHYSGAQRTDPALTVISGSPGNLTAMAPGDIVVMNIPGANDGAWGHVGIYLGGGQFLHAPRPGKSVEVVPISQFDTAEWAVRRVPAADLTPPAPPPAPKGPRS